MLCCGIQIPMQLKLRHLRNELSNPCSRSGEPRGNHERGLRDQ